MSWDESEPKRGKRFWTVRARMPDGKRPYFRLCPATESEKTARRLAAAWHARRAEMERSHLEREAERNRPAADVVTFRAFAERWTGGELAKLYPDHVKAKKTAADDVWRLEKHVYPVLGDKPIGAITRDTCDEVMQKLDSALRPGSRRQVAQLLVRVLGMAAYPAKLIQTSPLPKGYLPRKGPKQALGYLYPDEDRRLCGSAAVSLCSRVLYGFLHREGLRAGEAEALTWGDLDLERGTLRLDKNKTEDPRWWPLGDDVARALTVWKAIRRAVARSRGAHVKADAPVFVLEDGSRICVDRGAERYRAHLQAAGIDRPELYERTAARRPIRLHDTRATFVTISLANGRTDTWVKDRTGHRSSQMLENYRRAARTLAELELGPLAPLDQVIPELRGKAPGGELGQLGEGVAMAKTGWDAMEASVLEESTGGG